MFFLAGRACGACTNKPPNSRYVAPSGDDAIAAGASCTWRCNDGYFQDVEAGECLPCTVQTSETCGPGFIYSPCSPLEDADSSCSQECDADALGKPGGNSDETSEWVWTTFDEEDGSLLVQNPAGGLDGQPNVGCMWRCRDGYVLKEVDEWVMLEGADGAGVGGGSGTISFCVLA